jgi:hypothetical protein
MRLFEASMAAPNCVVSVMGDHAGEGADDIFNRKKTDINRLGKTFWLIRSPKARPAQVQGMCATIPSYTIFIEPATKGGARPTTVEDAAKEYSNNRVLWHRLPEGLSPVTGKLDAGAIALVFDMMTTDVSGRFVQRVPRSLHAQLIARAKIEGVSLNTLVVSIVSQGLGQRQTELIKDRSFNYSLQRPAQKARRR